MTDVDDWRAQAESVVVTCRRHLPGLVGVYIHGSAALGGMTTRSDLDILVVSGNADGVTDLGQALLSAKQPHPLELSVVAGVAAIRPEEPWPFLLHVNSADDRAVGDDGAGDPDLIAHYAVTRQSGIALWGPDADTVIGPIPRGVLLDRLSSELDWGLHHADRRYAVLNACRAVAYAETGRLLSKVDGADWWTRLHGPSRLVGAALEAQRNGLDLGCSGPDVDAFVNACRAWLRSA